MADFLRYLTIMLAAMVAMMAWAHLRLYWRYSDVAYKNTLTWTWAWYVAALGVIGLASIDLIGEPMRWITPLRPVVLIGSLLGIVRLYVVRRDELRRERNLES